MTGPFVVSRVFDAPRERVWQAWTRVEHLKRWFSPKGFSIVSAKMDFRPGGTYHYGLRMPNGQEMWGKWTFREIVEPERLVWVNAFSDKDGGLGAHPLNPDWPRQMLTRVRFEAQGAKTKFTLEWIPLEGSSELEWKTFDAGRDSMKAGWGGTLEVFEAYLAQQRD